MHTFIDFLFIIIFALLLYELSVLKNDLKEQRVRFDKLAKETGHEMLCSSYISENLRLAAYQLKSEGQAVKAVRLIRENTSLSLIEVKEYVDQL